MGRDFSKLHPRMQLKMLQLIMEAEKQGLKVKVTETFRTKEEQDALYAQGRTVAGNIVTNARGIDYSSCHQWGIAADVIRNDGRAAYDNSDGFFDKVGKIGQSIGLEWGGSWTSPVDKPHYQLPDWGSTPTKLKQLYGTPESFMKTWGNVEDLVTPKVNTVTFRTTKNGYLRLTPAGVKVKYDALSDTLKKKCKKSVKGYAVFLKDKKFSRIEKYTDKDGNVWYKLKSGYWFPAKYNGKTRVKKV